MHIDVEPIGVMRTAHQSKYDAPRQPNVFSNAEPAFIDLFPHKNYEQGLQDLEGFDRIWILSWFDRAGGWKPMVLPPRSHVKRGVFATRSPHRPNPIGISVARIVSIHGLTIEIANSDLLHGTPVLDIKPYIAYADAFPESASGWITTEARQPTSTVVFAEGIFTAAMSTEEATLRQHIERVLSLDPLPHPYRRTRQLADNEYVLAVRHLRVYYNIANDVVFVTNIVELPSKP